MKCLIPVLLLGVLTGCVNADLRTLRKAPPPSDPYLEALSKHYLAFAEEEARNYDWADVVHFTDKGLRTVYGHDVEPDDVDERDIPKDLQSELQDARRVLIAEMYSDARIQKPVVLARAVYFYDCWLEQQEEGWQPADIDVCKNGYATAMDALASADNVEEAVIAKKTAAKAVVKKKVKAKSATKATQTAKKSKPSVKKNAPKKKKSVEKPKTISASHKHAVATQPKVQAKPPSINEGKHAEVMHEPTPLVTSGRAILYFQPKTGELFNKSAQTLAAIARKLKGHDGYRITLHGYVDGKDGAQNNLKDSFKRAAQLKKNLIAEGLKADNIHVFAFGDAQDASQPLKDAGSGSLEESQRVEMLIE